MAEDIDNLRCLLLELRFITERIAAIPSPKMLRDIASQTYIILSGEDFNLIDSGELQYALQETRGITMTQESFYVILLPLCIELGMKCEACILLSDAKDANPPITSYLITLF